MQNNQKLAKNVINIVLLVLVLILVIQNSHLVNVRFFFFALRIPLLLLMAGLFAIGWYTSKLTGGVIDSKKIRDSLSKAEDSVAGVVAKGIEDTKDLATKAKDATKVVKKATTAVKKTTTPAKKAPTRRAPAKKTA